MQGTSKAPPGWDGLLDDGEDILWQGRPDGSFSVAPSKIGLAVFGTFFAGFALFWMVMAAQGGGIFWMFGLLHFGVGLSVIFGALFWDTLRRRFTWYTLTDRRAFIATDVPLRGRRLKSYPIRADTVLDFTRGDTFGTIHFAEITRRGKHGPYTVPLGFERLSDADAVMRLLRQIQRDAD